MDLYQDHKDLEAYIKDEKRFYKTPHGDYPSITTILGNTGNKGWLDVWRERVGHEEAARISKLATDEGTKVHDYMELYYKQPELIGFDEFFRASNSLNLENEVIIHCVKQLINVTMSNNLQPKAMEIALYNNKLRYAGRCDMVGYWNGELVILDYKTSIKSKKSEWVFDYYLQGCAYALAHNQMFGTKINKTVIAIAVKQEEKPQIFVKPTIPFENNLLARINEFYAKK